ncbi:zinc finger and SCAN domain-containing protein 29-like [Montipora capricornis]|uniref:zinc finger and SCAN domain-containing protein 29-like n=1 Tax=Montipora capricornis TaxID=246305 RepID=UPI0035F1ED69
MAASGVSFVAGKTQNWGFVETKTLICLWAEEDIQRQLASMGRKKNIWEGIAMKLQESGYSRSGDQCKTRMHNLQQKYKKVKTLNNTSGQGKNSSPFYEEIDKVLGHKPSINPLSTLSSAAGGSSSSSDNTLVGCTGNRICVVECRRLG